MTTEDEFQQLLDANPEDHHTRLVFADWLEERGDPRAEGYRALGALRRVPWYFSGARAWGYFSDHHELGRMHRSRALPVRDWLKVMEGNLRRRARNNPIGTRREAENAAAIAFAELPEARRQKLLAGARR